MLRLVLSPRWLVWHVLTLGAMVTCGFLAAWQWERAGSAMGSVVNIGYGVQWPIFAVFFGVMWWRLLRMEVRELRAAGGHRVVEHPVVEPGGGSGAGVGSDSVPVGAAGSGAGSVPVPAADPRPSPFRRAPAAAVPVAVDDGEDAELAEYNRMLAALARQDAADRDAAGHDARR